MPDKPEMPDKMGKMKQKAPPKPAKKEEPKAAAKPGGKAPPKAPQPKPGGKR